MSRYPFPLSVPLSVPWTTPSLPDIFRMIDDKPRKPKPRLCSNVVSCDVIDASAGIVKRINEAVAIGPDIQMFGYRRFEAVAKPRTGKHVLKHKRLKSENSTSFGWEFSLQNCFVNALPPDRCESWLLRRRFRLLAERVHLTPMESKFEYLDIR